ncbi:type I-B CRISPR-associated endonuclease Cas1b [Methanonatronarchaeum sp. AMET6-2]|uniref:type I-B CRISPR-associated endonuclease Cas1b n=1 Tax=Methanonatronarchaeum sp. AMET6-2 TaxID=2933293 RepID=UPI001211DD41|nr:type I-B CRISPR-associated endonuclease Cas1b [Methanonatronarchaeum sp. AMET6-2]RZN63105.1 MAG: type I-B CRISPR-associated endonuclease Cas1 [Methanonatronarchaeia archaeon]UOY10066.1 type I-B CRISPR-associated endonuclease Cas1b [Methanonatronarchaeum sp. AMET6-2]
MNKNDYYITQDGKLKRKENTIYFTNENTERAIPIHKIYTIYAYGSITMTSGAIKYLGKQGIPVHFFDYYGWYKSTLYPRETLISGDMVVKQSEHYLKKQKRIYLAKKIVEGAIKNIIKNLKYYSKNNKNLEKPIKKIESQLKQIEEENRIPGLMQIEGKARETYYQAIDLMMPEEYQINKRTRQPPKNKMNTLISFGNSKLYTTTLSEIYNTQLNPTISFLHEPAERRFSLSLDISEIFKPILVDRVIFKLINKNMLKDKHFESDLGNMLLSDQGTKLFLKEYDKRMERTIHHKGLDKKVSYRRLIRLELYKLAKHILGAQKYKPFVMWW